MKHVSAQYFESPEKGWGQAILPQGWVMDFSKDHREIIQFIKGIDPKLLKSKTHPVNITTVVGTYLNKKKGTAMVVTLTWHPPDACDPERKESGWSCNTVTGPIEDHEQIRAIAEFAAKIMAKAMEEQSPAPEQ